MRMFLLFMVSGSLAVLSGCGTTPVKSVSETPSKSWVFQQHQDFLKVAETSVTKNGVLVYLKGDFPFKVGRTRLSQDGTQKVDSIASVLKLYPKDQVTVLDYTDNSGKSARNLKLTQRRANSIKEELVKQGIPEGNITALGKGDTNPVASNDTDENRAQNRRAELDITMP